MSTRLIAGAAALIVMLLAAGIVAAALGPVAIPLDSVWSIAIGAVNLGEGSHTRTQELVLLQLRLPRILVAALVGAALATAGAVMQGLFRNPLADPGIIGVSAGGAMGAVLAIAFGVTAAVPLALPAASFAGAMGAALLVYGVASVGGRYSVATLLLAGVAVGTFLLAVVSAVLILAPSNQALRGIVFWLAGGLDGRSWEHVRLLLPPVLVGGLFLTVMARDLNLLMLGDDDARSLGVRVGRVRLLFLLAASLLTAVAVAVSGVIAFVGLIVPHILRLMVGSDHRVLVPLSGLGGALFLVVADTVTRTIVQPAELRVGIVTSFVGAPFFLFLLIRTKRAVDVM